MSASGQSFLPWTQEEDAELERLVANLGRTYAQCAEALGRTPRACESRWRTISRSNPFRRPSVNLWTPEEDAMLKELWPVLSMEQISERIGRTVKGIYRRANRLGLTCGNQAAKVPWTPEEDKMLKENIGSMTYAEIGELLGRSEKSVKHRALHLSLRGGSKPRPPKLDNVKRKCHDCGKPTPDYRCPSCWRKLRQRLGCPAEEESINEKLEE
jgi:hypothetical protein